MGLSYLALHQYNEGIEVLEQLSRLSNRFHLSQNALIIAYCMVWKFKKARELMEEQKQRAEHEYIASTLTGIPSAYLDDLDEAFNYLNKAYADKEPLLLSLKYQAFIPDNLRADKRFKSLLEKIGFPQ